MHPGWSADFSYAYFRQFLYTARRHFTASLLSKAPEVLQTGDSPTLFLRHDIKVSLKRALYMAEIEHEYNLPATYMVQVQSQLYSLNERNTRIHLLELVQMGHEVGLHFDLANDERQDQPFLLIAEKQVRAACERIEQIICRPVRSLSLYRPVPQLYNGPLLIDGRVNADTRDLRTCFLSDSAGYWRDGEPLSKISQPAGPILQILLHPIWWNKTHLSAPDRLQEFFESTTQDQSAREAGTFDISLAKALPTVRRQGICALVDGGVRT